MSQHDFNIANQGFPATRADINNAFQAIASNSSGPTAPSTTYANMWWYDTTNNKMYLRNEADSAWIEVATIDQTNNEWQITTGVVQAKDSDGLVLRTDDGTTRLALDDATGDILFYEDTGTTARMRWDASAQQLIIDGDSAASDLATSVTASALEINGDVVGGSAALWFGKASAGASYLQGANSAGSSSYSVLLNPYGGNVGIGTDSPSARLTVQDSSLPKIQANYNGAAHLEHGVGGSGCGFSMTTGHFMTFNHQPYANRGTDTNLTERMRVTSGGNLLINTTSSLYSNNHMLQLVATNGFGDGGMIIKHSDATGVTTVTCLRLLNASGTEVGTIKIDNSSAQFNTSSDYRLKENVTNISDGITRVKQLAPKRFNFILNPDKTVDGFLAHEAQTVVPEAVTGTQDAMRDEEYEVTAALGEVYTPAASATYDDDGNELTAATDEIIHSTDVERPETLADGQEWRETTAAVMGTRTVPDYQGIDQSKLVPLLTAALQEAIAKIEDLETRVAALESA